MKKKQINEIEHAKKIADKFGDILEAEHATNYSAVLSSCAIIASATKEHRKIADDLLFTETLLSIIDSMLE